MRQCVEYVKQKVLHKYNMVNVTAVTQKAKRVPLKAFG